MQTSLYLEKASQLKTKRVGSMGEISHLGAMDSFSSLTLSCTESDASINWTVTSLKSLDAMAVGKVCLYSNVGGLTELIKKGYNGMVFHVEDARNLAGKIISLSTDKEKYTGLRKNGLVWVKKERDWTVLIPKYNKIYKRLLGKQERGEHA